MNLEIISKSQVQSIVDAEIRRSETRMLKVIDRLRKRIVELETKKELDTKKLKLADKNKSRYKL